LANTSSMRSGAAARRQTFSVDPPGSSSRCQRWCPGRARLGGTFMSKLASDQHGQEVVALQPKVGDLIRERQVAAAQVHPELVPVQVHRGLGHHPGEVDKDRIPGKVSGQHRSPGRSRRCAPSWPVQCRHDRGATQWGTTPRPAVAIGPGLVPATAGRARQRPPVRAAPTLWATGPGRGRAVGARARHRPAVEHAGPSRLGPGRRSERNSWPARARLGVGPVVITAFSSSLPLVIASLVVASLVVAGLTIAGLTIAGPVVVPRSTAELSGRQPTDAR